MTDVSKFKYGDLLSIEISRREANLEVNVPFTCMEDLISWENMISPLGVVSLHPKRKWLRLKRKDNKAMFLGKKSNWAILLCVKELICIDLSSDWIYFKLISSKE